MEYLYAFANDANENAILLLHTDDMDEMINVLKSNDVTLVPAKYVYES